jgi:hypothetical protein
MSERPEKRVPKTQAASSGGPPKPPKETARGLEDEPPGGGKLSPNERAELAKRLRNQARKSK